MLPDSVNWRSNSPDHDVFFRAHNNLEVKIVIQDIH